MSRRAGGGRGRPAHRPPPDARTLARTLLERIERGGAWSGPLLLHHERRLPDRRDRALLHRIVVGTVHQRRRLDHALAAVSARPLEELDPDVLTVLRAAAYELLLLDRVPAFACVSSAVDAVRRARPRAAGFANAVLRAVARGGPALLPGPPAVGDAGGLALATSHPTWWAERVVERLGWTEAVRLLEANNRPAAPVVRANTARIAPRELAARLAAEGIATEPGRYAGAALRVTAGSPASSLALAEGLGWVQDEASQLAAELLAGAGARLADLCAAPGGKALQLAAAQSPGGLVVAADRHAGRLAGLAGRSHRAGLERNLVLLVADHLAWPPPIRGTFGGVLVDAPCSGTGTMRRNPEIRWRLEPADPARLAARQQRLLACAAPLVAPGGRLVYSVCSLEPEEGLAVVAAFLEHHPEFEAADAAGLLPGAAALVAGDGTLRTSPVLHGLDGFFAAVLVRRASRS